MCGVRLSFRAVESPEIADALRADVVPVIDLGTLSTADYTVGEVSEAAGRASFAWLKTAVTLARESRIDGFIMAPFESKALALAGHTMESSEFEPPGTYQFRINGPHTPESVSLLVTDRTRSDEPWTVLTGDTLFVGDVGRPDLGGAAASGDLYESLHGKLLSLPDYVEVYPAHISGSPCGRAMSGKPSSTIGF